MNNMNYAQLLNYLSNDYQFKRKGNKLDYEQNRSDVLKDNARRTMQPRNELCKCGSNRKFKKCCGKVK